MTLVILGGLLVACGFLGGWFGQREPEEKPPEPPASKPALPSIMEKPKQAELDKPSPAAKADQQAAEDERLASIKLRAAERFLDMSKRQDAIDYLEDILKRWPKTKAAADAKKLLEKIK